MIGESKDRDAFPNIWLSRYLKCKVFESGRGIVNPKDSKIKIFVSDYDFGFIYTFAFANSINAAFGKLMSSPFTTMSEIMLAGD
ncbi:hypothetical protein D3C79_661980 [compost metagenome]